MKRITTIVMGLCAWLAVNTATAASTSPFSAPDETDTSFVTDDGSGLDTGCTYRNGGPLQINLEIGRYVGEVDADGHLVNPQELIDNNVIGETATIRLPAWDIDLYGGGYWYAPEDDRVYVNGEPLGRLTGNNGVWKFNEFTIDVEKLKFPSRGTNGAKPTPAKNEINVYIDVANYYEVWCMAVDWVEVEFEAMAPVLMVHGTNAQSDTWLTPDVVTYLENNRIPFSSDINLDRNGSIDGNAQLLRDRVRELANEFGAKKVHLIAHSKGGLDSRRFLGTYYSPSLGVEPEVMSLYTITTPHHGTMLSDLSVANRSHEDAESSDPLVDEYLNSDDYVAMLGEGPQQPALGEQTTANMATFNTNNPFPSGIEFYTIAADADVDDDGDISDAEANPLIVDQYGGLVDAAEIGALMYQILGNVHGITITQEENLLGLNEWDEVTPTTGAFLDNDLVVTVPSARHPAGTDFLLLDRNHSSAKEDQTIQEILDNIQCDFPVN